jgi:hypothetical protein
MPALISETPEAGAWIDEAKLACAEIGAFGKIMPSVIWSDAVGLDGQMLVPIEPEALVADIRANSYPLLKGHDPGFPIGEILDAAVFTNPRGTRFIAAILGCYSGVRLSFDALAINPSPNAESPSSLPDLPNSIWIDFGIDPREVDSAWVDDVIRAAPIPVQRTTLAHNAADQQSGLIKVAVLFISLVWNPFVTTLATEAAKDVYAGIHNWLRSLLEKLAERKNPIVELQSHHNGCQISFIFRGGDVKRNYAAHDSLPKAASQAERLVVNIKEAGLDPKLIVYEFGQQDGLWFPSFVLLRDGRMITDNNALIAVEQLPPGLSLGLVSGRDKPWVTGV